MLFQSLSKIKRSTITTAIIFVATGIDEPLRRIGDFVKYIVLSVISCVLFIGSCLLCQVDLQPKTPNGIPLVAEAGIVVSIALAIFSIKKMSEH